MCLSEFTLNTLVRGQWTPQNAISKEVCLLLQAVIESSIALHHRPSDNSVQPICRKQTPAENKQLSSQRTSLKIPHSSPTMNATHRIIRLLQWRVKPHGFYRNATHKIGAGHTSHFAVKHTPAQGWDGHGAALKNLSGWVGGKVASLEPNGQKKRGKYVVLVVSTTGECKIEKIPWLSFMRENCIFKWAKMSFNASFVETVIWQSWVTL